MHFRDLLYSFGSYAILLCVQWCDVYQQIFYGRERSDTLFVCLLKLHTVGDSRHRKGEKGKKKRKKEEKKGYKQIYTRVWERIETPAGRAAECVLGRRVQRDDGRGLRPAQRPVRAARAAWARAARHGWGAEGRRGAPSKQLVFVYLVGKLAEIAIINIWHIFPNLEGSFSAILKPTFASKYSL